MYLCILKLKVNKMKRIVFVIIAVFCLNNTAFSQEEKAEAKQELNFFRNDNTFYLDNKRLSDDEIRKILSSNPSALKSWEKGNFNFNANKNLKIATGLLIGVGGVITIVSFGVAVTEAAATIALLPLMVVTNTTPERSYTGVWLTAGIIMFSAGIVTAIAIPITKTNYKDYYSDAAKKYNRGLQSKTAVSLHIGVTGNGFGLNLKF